jgi:integrase
MKFYGKNKPLDEITVESLDQFVATLLSAKYSDSSINRKLACISKFQNEALKRDRLQKKTYIPRRKERKGRIRFITGEEEQSIIQLLTQYDHQDFLDFLLVLVDTGMRRGEVLTSLVAKDIDFQQNIITIWENKADHPRSVPMTKRVRAILQRRLKVHPFILFPHKGNWGTPIWNHVKSAMGLAHDEQFVPHCLRHTCASRLVQRGINLKVVQEWLGHKNIMMTMRYAHLAPKNLHDAVYVLEPITPLRVVKNGTDGTGSVPESEEIT